MKVTKVKYSRLISDHNYNNQSFGAESEVLDGETPEDVRADLVLWVGGNSVDKWKVLYIKINEMLSYLGAEGEVTTYDGCVCDVMNALADIDGGTYNTKRVFGDSV